MGSTSKIFPFKKALVTGGAGFIGSHVVEALVELGVETISVDDYFAGKRENLAHLSSYKNFNEVTCDITDFKKLKPLFAGVDIVFHLAASKKTICINDPRRDLQINAEGTFNLLELAVEHKVKKFVHSSTGSVYGEAQYFPQDEDHPLNPASFYGVSKLAGERYVGTFQNVYGLNTTILRYFHIYGPRQESSDVGGVVSIFVRKMLAGQPITIFGDGTQQRSFTWVKDVVEANMRAAVYEGSVGQVYNCASGIKVTIAELAQHVQRALGIKNQPLVYEDWVPGDIKIFDVGNSKIRRELGLEFLLDFEKGLQLTIDWAHDYFQKQGAQDYFQKQGNG